MEPVIPKRLVQQATRRIAKFLRTIERAHKNAAKSRLVFP